MTISSCFQSEWWKVHVSAGGSRLLIPFQNVAPECKLTVSEVRFKCTSAIHICGKRHCHYQKCPAAWGSPKSVLNFVLLQRTCFKQSTASYYRYQWVRFLLRIVFSNCHRWIWKSPTSCISELSEPLPLNFQRHTNTNTVPWSFGR